MSTHLTAGQRAWLEAELRQRQQGLRNQLAAHLHGQTRAERAAENLAQDADDAPQRAPERAIAAALTSHEERELQGVSEALDRLGGPTFGCCSDCGQGIAFDRLKAEPWATRCMPCETAHERPRRFAL